MEQRTACARPGRRLGRELHCVPVSESERPVVFAMDFHATIVSAMRLAATMAQVTDSPLHCLHVLPHALEGGGQAAAIPAILLEALQHVAATFFADFRPRDLQLRRDRRCAAGDN